MQNMGLPPPHPRYSIESGLSERRMAAINNIRPSNERVPALHVQVSMRNGYTQYGGCCAR